MTLPIAMAPKRARLLVAPGSSARASARPQLAKRSRNLLENRERRTPSPQETRHRQRVLPAPKVLARRLGRAVWGPDPVIRQGAEKSALIEDGLGFATETSSATASPSSGRKKGTTRVLEARKRRRRKVITIMLESGDIVPNMTCPEYD